ncbi:transmembrane protein 132A [Alligator mississippiensis]|uniref:Transmembrane protein 132A n=1 Tax=Alligator mississippiensis TaxID=8496 RepID=A0A151NXS2_ALLMI|nr:transmembrane protein 132A [Alligator mississippiensis]KYO41681.1 transmembrane protein 132A [Alligator mississippiensis]
MGSQGSAPCLWLVLLAAVALETARVNGDSDPLDPVYLPAELEVLDMPNYFRLQRTDRYLPGNVSLGSRSETYLLLHHQPTAQPVIQATYLPFTARQVAPTDDPRQRDSPTAWNIRAVSIEGSVSPAEPYARVLFHLKGQDWLTRRQDLPCVWLHAYHHMRAVHGACRLQAPLGVCVVELEIPPRWFSSPSTASHSQHRAMELAERAELYYSLVPGECGRAGLREKPRLGSEIPKESLLYVGSMELRVMDPPRRQEVRLDDSVLIRVPDMALRPGQLFTATLILQQNFTADQLTLRIKLKKGLQVLAARPAVPEAWTAKLDKFKGSKHHTALVTCHQVDNGQLEWSAADFPEFLYLDLLVENGTGGLASTRPVTWQVEYPGQDPEAEKDKMVWEIQVSERDVRALVPLVKEQEIVNTALLTGVPQSVPVKLVAVEMGGAVFEVTEQMSCESANKQVLQVTDACDSIYVGGKESRGAHGARVDFWFRRFHASALFTIWVPLLPLRVELTDTTLEQVRGWRLPSATSDSSPAEPEEPGEDVEKRVRSCRLQYQRASVRFLAHFVAHPLDGGRHLTYMPSSDWLLDVSHLVGGRARVQDPRVATLEGGSVVIGREPGVTSVEVRSPVSDSILGEQTLVVSDEKVSVVELRAQLVSGLSLALSTEPGHPNILTATCQALTTLQSPKQEAALSVWLEFSDHTLAPSELYGWRDVVLLVSSLDPSVATVRLAEEQIHPAIVAEGPGHGPLLQLSLHTPDSCRKGKHKAPLASGTAWLEVGIARHLPTAGSPHHHDPHPHAESPFQRAEGAMSGEAVTAATETVVGPRKRDPAGVGPVLTKFQGHGAGSSEEDSPGGEGEEDEEEEDEMVKAPERVTDLEIGMYVLLGVFCLAIFIFLVNCVFFVLRYQRKEPPDAGLGPVSTNQQPHNWVWLGTDQEELGRQLDRRIQHSEPSPEPAPDPSAPPAKDGGCCCCGTPPGTEMGTGETPAPEVTGPDITVPTSTFLPTAPGSPVPTSTLSRKEASASGGRRKRVEFVTFATPRAPEDTASPPPAPVPAPASNVQSILVASEDDIRWVCEDMGLRDPDALRSYMERIRGSS